MRRPDGTSRRLTNEIASTMDLSDRRMDVERMDDGR
jgi:hypothetical protein